ncbi:hypothetical protein SAMN05444166_5581 [Singulisphaera sp. GP187]|uniref:hypothetical protein n=1 Tax=Singulisphaera sp. GP187 TaxID=1882752 RepID=UPI00092B8CB3|nr:hypothetical protein [Singulisphaera sp. GP187]SIO58168.1 hypothetical protein SAMN05444166_5581 [Singulisphaera sp. GP187]
MVRMEKMTERFEALSNLMDRLCAPDLMLPEATVLRNRLSVLLAHEDEAVEVDHEARPRSFVPTAPRSEKGRAGNRSPLCMPCLAGCC